MGEKEQCRGRRERREREEKGTQGKKGKREKRGERETRRGSGRIDQEREGGRDGERSRDV